MKVKATIPYFGGKRTMAPEIAAQLGKHTQYFEPFCGSLAVLFAKDRSPKETVNDLHGDAINLAKVIQHKSMAEHLYERLSRALSSEGLLRDARKELARTPIWEVTDYDDHDAWSKRCDRAYWYFLASWMGRNGTAGTSGQDYQMAVRWTKGGGSPTVRWRNALESLPAWHQRLQNVVILCRDAFGIIGRFEDCKETAIYVDPPYVIDGASRTGVKSEGDQSHTYLHEFSNGSDMPLLGESSQDDHERLRDCLETYKHARIVVSYYDCQRVRELYDGWTFIDKTRQKHLHNQAGGRGGKEAPELLIINGLEY